MKVPRIFMKIINHLEVKLQLMRNNSLRNLSDKANKKNPKFLKNTNINKKTTSTWVRENHERNILREEGKKTQLKKSVIHKPI